jgi:MFS family permease
MFRALRSPAYARFWAGAFVSSIGSWMHNLAFGWLVYQLTDSAFWLGITSFIAMLPSLTLSLVGGVIADRTDRRRLLLATQVVHMACALTLAGLTAAGIVTLGEVIALSLVSGVALALATPVYQALIPDLVPPGALMSAISLNSVQFNLARAIGPALGGVAIAAMGLGACFLLNGLSFLAMILALATLRIEPRPVRPPASLWSELREGIVYAWHEPTIRTALLLAGTLSLFAVPYLILMPVFARDVLHVGVTGLGYLMAAAGVGAVAGGLGLAAFGNVPRKGLIATTAAITFSLSLIGFALSPDPWLSGGFLFLVGLSMVSALATLNTVLQMTTDDRLRGRVMSMLALALFGLAPVGSLQIGTLAHWMGAPRAVALGGALCLAMALYLLVRAPELRRPVRSVVTEVV